MLWRDKREVVGKTGWTRVAQHCFVGQIGLYGDHKVFVAMLGSHRLWKDLKMLVDYEFGVSFVKSRTPKKIVGIPGKTFQIQKALKKAGFYKGPLNGRMTRSTKRAIRAFQKRNHLPADGIAGAKTWNLLKKLAS